MELEDQGGAGSVLVEPEDGGRPESAGKSEGAPQPQCMVPQRQIKYTERRRCSGSEKERG